MAFEHSVGRYDHHRSCLRQRPCHRSQPGHQHHHCGVEKSRRLSGLEFLNGQRHTTPLRRNRCCALSIVPSSITVGNLLDRGQFLAIGTYSTPPTVRDLTNSVQWLTSCAQHLPRQHQRIRCSKRRRECRNSHRLRKRQRHDYCGSHGPTDGIDPNGYGNIQLPVGPSHAHNRWLMLPRLRGVLAPVHPDHLQRGLEHHQLAGYGSLRHRNAQRAPLRPRLQWRTDLADRSASQLIPSAPPSL